MPQSKFDLGKWFARVTPNCDSIMMADWYDAVDNIGQPVPLAQDSTPKGGQSMPYPTRPTRDEDVIPNSPRGMTPRGGMSPLNIDQDPDDPQYDPDDPGAAMTPETLASFVQLCANKLAQANDNGESHNQFMNILGQMVSNAHQQGMQNGGPPNGDRKRVSRDNGYRATPAGGISNFNGRGSMDRQRRAAQDSAFIKRNLDSKSFLQRYPDARKISIR